MSLLCTMAFGERYARQARYLVADLRDQGVRILILTDHPEFFQTFGNALVHPLHPRRFSYHLKKEAVRAAIAISGSATFIDADCVIRPGVSADILRKALIHGFSPGFHCWKISPIAEAGPYLYPATESAARELGITYDRDAITCQEMLFNVTAEGGKEEVFLELWDRLEAHPGVIALPLRDPVHGGGGEGTVMGIAASGSGITMHGTEEMDRSMLPRVFWHCALDYRMRPYHKARESILKHCGLLQPADLSKTALA